ncbi:CHY zinc finger protein [Streptomyces sp. AC495_CC817]|uniref:CHY zinc finger protein n=1 Tax=Streptomyces sp. AC495_CC817 TaxID=2823900 RepID=UPI001C2772AF|nr:CHY zinc finger protein [Streptomyces sp. AC495_CC817]
MTAPAPRPPVHGRVVDDMTRCAHYASALDIVAIRFACCREYYPCHLCHAEAADHEARQWSRGAHEERAILCGACGHELMIATYLEVSSCPECDAPFNPGCAAHAPLYFEV